MAFFLCTISIEKWVVSLEVIMHIKVFIELIYILETLKSNQLYSI